MRVSALLLTLVLLSACSGQFDPVAGEGLADFDLQEARRALDATNPYEALGVPAYRFRSAVFARGEVGPDVARRDGFMGEIEGEAQRDPPAMHLLITYKEQKAEWLQIGGQRWVREAGGDWEEVEAFVNLEPPQLFPYTRYGHSLVTATFELDRGQVAVVGAEEVNGLKAVHVRVSRLEDAHKSVTTTDLWITPSGVLVSLRHTSASQDNPEEAVGIERTWDLYRPAKPLTIKPPGA